MTDARKHRTDDPSACWFCKNFHLVPIGGAGVFKCSNKNTPDELKTCFNYDEREKDYDSSFSIHIHPHF